MDEEIKETKYAVFCNGELKELKIDFKDFDIPVQNYLNGDDVCSAFEYRQIMFEVAKRCNENGNYTVAYENGRYHTVMM